MTLTQPLFDVLKVTRNNGDHPPDEDPRGRWALIATQLTPVLVCTWALIANNKNNKDTESCQNT